MTAGLQANESIAITLDTSKRKSGAGLSRTLAKQDMRS
jgi:hypothetical protein